MKAKTIDEVLTVLFGFAAPGPRARPSVRRHGGREGEVEDGDRERTANDRVVETETAEDAAGRRGFAGPLRAGEVLRSSAYRAAAAVEKQDFLWRAVRASRYSGDRLPSRSRRCPRPGVAARVRYVAQVGHPYTGLFSTGARGLAKLWVGREGEGHLPRALFVFLVDAEASRDLTVGPGLDPIARRDFFASALTNVPARPAELPFSIDRLLAPFRMAAFDDRVLHPLTHLASIEADGGPVDEPRAPHRVFLRPAVEGVFDRVRGFRAQTAGRLGSGTTIYTIDGLDPESDAQPVGLGGFVLESPFVASWFGDHCLGAVPT